MEINQSAWVSIGYVYKTLVRPAMMYMGSEKAQKLDMAEMMSRWMCGVATLERIRNEITIGVTKVGEIFYKVQKEANRVRPYNERSNIRVRDGYAGAEKERKTKTKVDE